MLNTQYLVYAQHIISIIQIMPPTEMNTQVCNLARYNTF